MRLGLLFFVFLVKNEDEDSFILLDSANDLISIINSLWWLLLLFI